MNIHHAKTHLSRLIERVALGETFVIAKSGRPVAQLIPIVNEPRRPGALKGRIVVAEDFDAPLPDDILSVFAGDSE